MARTAVTYYREEDHRQCEAPWECTECGRQVCPRCDPSPSEPKLCVECHWFMGPLDVA